MKNKIIKPKISYTEYFNIREIDYSIDNKECLKQSKYKRNSLSDIPTPLNLCSKNNLSSLVIKISLKKKNQRFLK